MHASDLLQMLEENNIEPSIGLPDATATGPMFGAIDASIATVTEAAQDFTSLPSTSNTPELG